MTDRSRETYAAVRKIVAPALKEEGFAYDGKRFFRRHHPDGRVDIVSYQLGLRSIAGRFTVNLSIYLPGDYDAGSDPKFRAERVTDGHCVPSRRTRLGMLVPPAIPALARLPKLGFLFQPKDQWWPCGSSQEQTEREVASTLRLLRDVGLRWFNPPARPSPLR